eukprot:2121564-Rhodomonas_salina.1
MHGSNASLDPGGEALQKECLSASQPTALLVLWCLLCFFARSFPRPQPCALPFCFHKHPSTFSCSLVSHALSAR